MRRVLRGLVNYHVEEPVENYKIYIDADGIPGNRVDKYTLKTTEVELEDVSTSGKHLNFSRDGLAFAKYPTRVGKLGDEIDDTSREVYDKELEEIIRSNLENVSEVEVFDHTIRSDTSTTRPPARHVHGDYTARSAHQRVRDVVGEHRAKEWLKEKGHFGIVNIWRPLDSVVERSPLGFIEGCTVEPEDWHEVSIIYADRVGKILGVVGRNTHRWVVMDKMDTDMVWIFCQYDSAGLCAVPHSAVEVLGTEKDARPRRSIESRILVRYD